MEYLIGVLIVLVIADIVHREIIHQRQVDILLRDERAKQDYAKQLETRRGNDDVLLERLDNTKYTGHATEEQKDAPEWEVPPQTIGGRK